MFNSISQNYSIWCASLFVLNSLSLKKLNLEHYCPYRSWKWTWRTISDWKVHYGISSGAYDWCTHTAILKELCSFHVWSFIKIQLNLSLQALSLNMKSLVEMVTRVHILIFSSIYNKQIVDHCWMLEGSNGDTETRFRCREFEPYMFSKQNTPLPRHICHWKHYLFLL